MLDLICIAPRSVPGPDLSSIDHELFTGCVMSSVSLPKATSVSSPESSVSGIGKLVSNSELLFGISGFYLEDPPPSDRI